MRTCFTINCMRTNEDFIGYQQLLSKNLFQGIEIFFPYNVSEGQKTLYTEGLKQLLDQYPVEVVMHLPHGPNNNLLGEHAGIVLERMKEAMDYANQFKGRKLTLHLGAPLLDCSRDSSILAVIEVLCDLCHYAKRYEMFIMIENMPGFSELGCGVSEMKYILESVHNRGYNNIKFILDTGHSHVSKIKNEDYIYQLKDYLYHIHFSDNDGTRDQHKRIHEGTIDFERVFASLSDIGYCQLHCLEIIFSVYTDLIHYLSDIAPYDQYYKNEVD